MKVFHSQNREFHPYNITHAKKSAPGFIPIISTLLHKLSHIQGQFFTINYSQTHVETTTQSKYKTLAITYLVKISVHLSQLSLNLSHDAA